MTRQEFEQWWELFSIGQPWRVEYRAAAWSLASNDSSDEPVWLQLVLEHSTSVLVLRAWLFSLGRFENELNLRYQLYTSEDDAVLRAAFRESQQALANCSFYGSPYITTAIAQEYLWKSGVAIGGLSPLAQLVIQRSEQGGFDLSSALLLLGNGALQQEFRLAPPEQVLTGEYLRMWNSISKKA